MTTSFNNKKPATKRVKADVLGLLLAMIAVFPIGDLTAAPIRYRFTWEATGTITRTFQNEAFQMQFVGDPGAVEGTGNFVFNTGLAGSFSGLGFDSQIPDWTLSRTRLSRQPRAANWSSTTWSTSTPLLWRPMTWHQHLLR